MSDTIETHLNNLWNLGRTWSELGYMSGDNMPSMDSGEAEIAFELYGFEPDERAFRRLVRTALNDPARQVHNARTFLEWARARRGEQ